VINKNPWGERLITELFEESSSIPITISSGNRLIASANGITGKYKSVSVQSNMLGAFNSENWAVAIDVALQLGISPDSIAKSIQNFPGVRGRLERVPNKKKINILIDYAHKPDALDKVLKTIRSIAPFQKIITVFGCGGDRDKAKRPLMGSISEATSDWIILTNDNPRTENPEQILDEIQSGMSGIKPCERIPDRKKAIKRAIELAHEGDFVIIAGKGHETEQIVGENKILFDDREVTLQLLDE
jgi:UDP-N-acetylmuramoyl-L-alanyl-D-glutamate--2,6-diaminopimelate ligase